MGGPARRPSGSAPSFFGEVPLDIKIRETSDGGTPLTVAEPDNPHALVFRGIAAWIWEKVSGADARAAPRPGSSSNEVAASSQPSTQSAQARRVALAGVFLPILTEAAMRSLLVRV